MKLCLKSSLNLWQISNPNPNVRVKLTIQKYELTFTHNLRTHIGEKSKQILRGSAIHKYELALTHEPQLEVEGYQIGAHCGSN